MTSQGPAARLMDLSLLFPPFFLSFFSLPFLLSSSLLLSSPRRSLPLVGAFPPFTPSRVWWHILYTCGKDAERDETEGGGWKRGRGGGGRRRKEKRDRRFLLVCSGAYCVILATVAAGVIIISKEGQNTGPESHNAEFYDFWHRGQETGCNATFYRSLTSRAPAWCQQEGGVSSAETNTPWNEPRVLRRIESDGSRLFVELTFIWIFFRLFRRLFVINLTLRWQLLGSNIVICTVSMLEIFQIILYSF